VKAFAGGGAAAPLTFFVRHFNLVFDNPAPNAKGLQRPARAIAIINQALRLWGAVAWQLLAFAGE
jgi:hypothetical protein